MTRRLALLALVCVATGLSVSACGSIAAPSGAASRTVSAQALLETLAVQPEDHSLRYDRLRFGYDEGFDADGDGCTTRKEVLIRDAVSIDHVSRYCAVYGVWRSPYDDRVTDSPYDLEIDHLVPLVEAWRSGADRWSRRRQVAFGNDLGYPWELQAVTAALNQDKGDGDPAQWMPPRNRCVYAKAWIGVKARWDLSIDRLEETALRRWLATCDSLQVLRPGTPDLGALVGD